MGSSRRKPEALVEVRKGSYSLTYALDGFWGSADVGPFALLGIVAVELRDLPAGGEALCGNRSSHPAGKDPSSWGPVGRSDVGSGGLAESGKYRLLLPLRLSREGKSMAVALPLPDGEAGSRFQNIVGDGARPNW